MARMDFLGEKASAVVTGAISVVVILAILAAVAPLIFESVGDINVVFTDNSSLLNNSVAEAIAPVFPILIALSVLLGLVTFILSSTDLGDKLRKR